MRSTWIFGSIVGVSSAAGLIGVYGYSYDHPGRSTEEYVQILCGVLRGEVVDLDGEDFVHGPVSDSCAARSELALTAAGVAVGKGGADPLQQIAVVADRLAGGRRAVRSSEGYRRGRAQRVVHADVR